MAIRHQYYSSTIASQHHAPPAPTPLSTTLTPQHHSTTAPQHHSTTAPQHHSTTAPQHRSTAAPQHQTPEPHRNTRPLEPLEPPAPDSQQHMGIEPLGSCPLRSEELARHAEELANFNPSVRVDCQTPLE
ncbi:hypothetical protein RJ55_05540 [Drechmeria coniospora]|nr:hypothetical protein RJ55_05540 [Drechmeria coniospora]